MSWGLSLTSPGSALIIDQSFPGHYLDTNNPRYITANSFTNPVPASGSGTAPALVHGTFLRLPSTSQGLLATDGIFCRPPGPLAHMSSTLGWATMDYVHDTDGIGGLCIRTPCHILHYKSLAGHPVALSGWGMAVFTPAGQQAFNSAGHQKRLDVIVAGSIGPSHTIQQGTYYNDRVVLLTPGDSIANYYGFISLTSTYYVSPSWGPGLPSGGAAPIGTAYEYDFSNNRISLVGTALGQYDSYYCVARVSG